MTVPFHAGPARPTPADHAEASTGASRPATYSRFIARDELKDVTAWAPADLSSGEGARVAPSGGWGAQPSAQMEKALKAARHAGYQEGYQHGLSALQDFKDTHARQVQAQFAHLVAAFEHETQALDETLAQHVTRMALTLARQVVRDELTQHPERVVRVAQDAVDALLGSARHVVVHLHPDDHALVAHGAHDSLVARGVRLVADATVQRAGVRVESDVGRVDASIEKRWALVSATFGLDLPWSEGAESAAHGIDASFMPSERESSSTPEQGEP